MSTITITAIQLGNIPLNDQVVEVRHRLTSDPDIASSYVLDTLNLSVNPDGSLDSPFVIDGLEPDTSYTVWVIHRCSGSSITKVFETEPIYIATRTDDFSRSNCSVGEEGSTVSFTKQYMSTISQQDAEDMADADAANFLIEGQAYANANGECIDVTVPCGEEIQYTGGESYPTEQIVTLGSDLGTVTLSYNAFGIPDKFIVIFDGVEVINTGYRGDASQQTALNDALSLRGEGPETIQGTGVGSATFNKNSSTTTAILRIYAPMSGTSWEAQLSCPE
jgi:hypothetical protein